MRFWSQYDLSAKTQLIRAALWTVLSIFFIDSSWGRVTDLRDAGRYVSPFRYAQVAFWIVILAFWIWNGWQSWRRFSEEKQEQKVV